MVGRAKSDALKKQEARQAKDTLMQEAVRLYRMELEKESSDPSRNGARTICARVSEEHMAATGENITLNHGTLIRLSDPDNKSLSDFNASKSWLTPEEHKLVTQYCVEVAERGFPMNHKRLKEIVDHIVRARVGEQFPGVGKNWTDRFVQKHAAELGTYWSRPLDSKRGQAVNPVANEAWWTLLLERLIEDAIVEECFWATDEVGFKEGEAVRTRVIGPAGVQIVYQQSSGNRGTTTVIATICAGGTSIPPAVLYKGHAFLVKWCQENPLNAS